LRIVKGRWAGTDLVSPAARVRPTTEKLRDDWLDVLQPRLEGARVLDLFAGSGALGLEALSRGAASADFVENAPAALHALKANVAKLGLKGPSAPRARVFKRDAIPFVEALDEGAYDVAFADPPYGSGKLDRVLAAWRATRFATVLGVEHAPEHELPPGGRLIRVGDGTVTLYGLSGRGRDESRR
jgi:16S rRNA (guanine966-N2)-methyltransferase